MGIGGHCEGLGEKNESAQGRRGGSMFQAEGAVSGNSLGKRDQGLGQDPVTSEGRVTKV